MIKGGLPNDFIDEVRSKNDIVDVASKYLTLNRRGGNFWACCPFHNEKTPSFSIKQDAQFYKCFGCGESGNVITLVMKMENVDFLTAVEMLAKNAGLEMPTDVDNVEMQKRKRERERVYQILRATTDFYHNNLLNNHNTEQYKYLQTRGINDEMISKFQIGASLDYDSLPKHLKKLGFSCEDMTKAGVIGTNENGRVYDFYGRRLMFPIFNGFGDVVAFSGRSVEQNVEHTKYKNTPQTIVFNKSEIMFGFNFVRDLKKQNNMLDTIVIVEGHIDVIACHQAGITNTIGCMGTALTSQHTRKIKQLVENVILCLDGDSAGANATYKAIDVLKEGGLNVKVVRLVGAKDPDEFIKKYGKEKFLEVLSSAIDCVDFVLNDSSKKYDLNNNSDRTKYIQESLNYISKFSTPAEQEVYLGVVQKLVKIPIDALRKSLNVTQNENRQNEQQLIVPEKITDNYLLESKIMLLASILYKKVDNFADIEVIFSADDELKPVYEYLKQKLSENKNISVAGLFDEFNIDNNSLIDRVINYNFPDEKVFNAYLNDTIKRVKRYALEQEREKIKQKMLSATTEDEQIEFLTKLQDITNKMKE